MVDKNRQRRYVTIVTVTMPDDHRWHPGQEFGVSQEGELIYRRDDGGWAISPYDDSGPDGAGVVHLLLKQMVMELSLAWESLATGE